MVVCQFFLQGRCKFGENCRNEHPRGGAQRSLFNGPSQPWQGGGGQRVTFRDSFGASGQASSNQYKWTANQQQGGQGSDSSNFQQTSTLDIVNGLPKEMESWEKSHMWLFSCFAVDKDLPSLPEFYDICPEELRFEAYQAIKSGNVQSYAQRIQSLQSEFQNRRRLLQNMTMDLKSKLIAVIDEARKNKQTQSSSSSSSVFGSTQPTQNLFGQSNASTSSDLFGKSSGAAGGSTPGLIGKSTRGSTFGGMFSSEVENNSGSFASPVSSLFGKPVGTGSVFGNQPQGQTAQTANQFGQVIQSNAPATSCLFGQQVSHLFGNIASVTTNQSSNSFGSPAASPLQGLFGKTASGLANTSFAPGNSAPSAQQTSLFNSAPSAQQTSLFNSAPSAQQTSLFNSAPSAQQTSLFNSAPSAQQTSLFNSAPSLQQTSLFGGYASPTQSSATLFGKPVPESAATTQNTFGSAPPGQGQGQSCGDMTGQGQSSAFGGASSAASSGQGHYTPLIDLTEQEKEAFSAKAFELGRIPIRPPPRQMIS